MGSTKIRTSQQVHVDANLDVNSNKLVNVANGSNPNDAVNYSQLQSATSGIASGLHTPVADLAAAKAVPLAGRNDKMLMLIETLGLYRYDLESTATSDNISVIRPTDIATDATAGRWIRITTVNNYVHPNHSGDVTSAGDGAQTISAKAVTNAKMADVATQTFKGRNTAATGAPEDLSVATVKTMLGMQARTYRATPVGVINGSNTVFTVAALIISGTEEIFKNGFLMNAGAGNDYTIQYNTPTGSTTITFIIAPNTTDFTDVILINYSVLV